MTEISKIRKILKEEENSIESVRDILQKEEANTFVKAAGETAGDLYKYVGADQPEIERKNPLDSLKAGVAGGAQSLTIGGVDEGLAGLAAIYEKVTGAKESFGELYEKHQGDIDSILKEWEALDPVTGMAARLYASTIGGPLKLAGMAAKATKGIPLVGKAAKAISNISPASQYAAIPAAGVQAVLESDVKIRPDMSDDDKLKIILETGGSAGLAALAGLSIGGLKKLIGNPKKMFINELGVSSSRLREPKIRKALEGFKSRGGDISGSNVTFDPTDGTFKEFKKLSDVKAGYINKFHRESTQGMPEIKQYLLRLDDQAQSSLGVIDGIVDQVSADFNSRKALQKLFRGKDLSDKIFNKLKFDPSKNYAGVRNAIEEEISNSIGKLNASSTLEDWISVTRKADQAIAEDWLRNGIEDPLKTKIRKELVNRTKEVIADSMGKYKDKYKKLNEYISESLTLQKDVAKTMYDLDTNAGTKMKSIAGSLAFKMLSTFDNILSGNFGFGQRKKAGEFAEAALDSLTGGLDQTVLGGQQTVGQGLQKAIMKESGVGGVRGMKGLMENKREPQSIKTQLKDVRFLRDSKKVKENLDAFGAKLMTIDPTAAINIIKKSDYDDSELAAEIGGLSVQYPEMFEPDKYNRMDNKISEPFRMTAINDVMAKMRQGAISPEQAIDDVSSINLFGVSKIV